MPDVLDSIHDPAFLETISAAKIPRSIPRDVDGNPVPVEVPYPSPADWRDVWIYFIMVDRFNNPTNPPNHAPWDAPCGVFQGGNIPGIAAKLDYLKDLGVGAIWITPIFQLCSNQPASYHGYGFQHLLAVDPHFATEEELRNFVLDAHARGIRVVFDVILNHTGDVFAYDVDGSLQGDAPYRHEPYGIRWRDGLGNTPQAWTEAPETCDPIAAVHPKEIRANRFFRRKGMGGEAGGDFYSLKELVTDHREWNDVDGNHHPVRNVLIAACKHLIARFDVDGFRIDTLKYVEREFAQSFGNSMREYALSIGKKNFFTFGEVWETDLDQEDKLQSFFGRNASNPDELMGVDAALDFPLYQVLTNVVKGRSAPGTIIRLFENRKKVQTRYIGSHGESSKYFVTFLDNHDIASRFHYVDPGSPSDAHRYDAQLLSGVALLFCLQGIPCLYYGTEQGLHGMGGDLAVREALWGKGPTAFDQAHPFYANIAKLSAVRDAHPELRYGRQYFRPITSPDGGAGSFGFSEFSPGVLAFSRLLSETEVVVVANMNLDQAWRGKVLVDFSLNPFGTAWEILYSNVDDPAAPSTTLQTDAIRCVLVDLKPMEIQILRRKTMP